MSAAAQAAIEIENQGLRGFHWPNFAPTLTIRHVFAARCPAAPTPLHLRAEGNLALSGGRDREAAVACRRIWVQSLGGQSQDLVVGSQVHGTHVAHVDETHRGRGAEQASTVLDETDGLFTTLAGLPLYIAVADCGGVLLAAGAGSRRALAVVHAGWRGLAGGILARAVDCFQEQGFPTPTIQAWIAPCIRAAAYEVGPEVATQAPVSARSRGQGDRWQVDIAQWAQHALGAAGIPLSQVAMAGLDTGQDPRLFSHRRQGPGAGRNGLFAMISP